MTVYAYTPEEGEAKLPIDTPRDIANAITALGPSGFRGNRVSIPKADRPGVVSAIRKRINAIVSDDDQKQNLLDRLSKVKSYDNNLKALSLDEQASIVRQAFNELMDITRRAYDLFAAPGDPRPQFYWINEVYPDYVIACYDNGHYSQVAYSIQPDGIEFAPPDEWVTVEKEWVQAKALDPVVFIGSQVKALGDGWVEGPLVTFTTENDPDLTGEFFDAKTDFDLEDGEKVSIYYHHGRDSELKNKKLGREPVEIRKQCIWLKHQLDMRDAYEAMMYQLSETGKMGWSSGPAQHLVRKEHTGKAVHITHWPIKEASLTPIPAEYRNAAVPLKSLPLVDWKALLTSNPSVYLTEESEPTPEAVKTAATGASAVSQHISVTDSTVTITAVRPTEPIITEIKTMTEVTDAPVNTPAPDAGNEESDLKQEMKLLSKKFDEILNQLQNTPSGEGITYTNMGGGGDPAVKSLGDFALAVARDDKDRLRKVYQAKAVQEDQGSTGGYMVPQDFSAQLIAAENEISPVINWVRTFPVNSPAGDWPTLDIYTAPTAGAGNTAMAAQLVSSVIAEAGTFTDRSVKFKMINWRVAKVGDLVKASSELMEDAPALDALLRQLMTIALAAKKERNILRGNGVGEPLGILNAPALISYNPATTNVFAWADSVGIRARFKMFGGDRARVKWVYHSSVLPDIAAFQVASGSAATWIANMQSDDPKVLSLLTYPLYESEHMPQADNDNSVGLIDFGAYGLWQRGQIDIAYSKDYAFNTDEVAWRFKERYDGRPLIVSSVTQADPQGSYTKSAFIGLNATHV